MASIPMDSASAGESTIGMAKPRYCAMVSMPSAVALSLNGNQLAATLVVTLSRNGCPAASMNWDIAIIVKESANAALVKPKIPVSRPPIIREALKPYLSITYDAGIQHIINIIM